ncbi:MAG: response regulator transcription factor [Rhodospirillales bacterium]|nr:response regulator transcription factor [Rhodospirillales bacterium]MBO6787088.1 response regulator transcription factor [Rhodospirillales bacterium]
MRILVVEDDKDAAAFIAKALGEAGHIVDVADNGEDALGIASEAHEVLIVDRMMPKLDGLQMVEQLRSQGIATPVLFLSALGKVDDRVAGLRAGGDDYLVKPFAMAELLARVEALGRRKGAPETQTKLTCGDLELDLISRDVSRGGEKIDLQPREFKLLEYLMRNAGRVVTRSMLLENVWDYHFDPQTNVIDVHISRLRGKIDKGFDTQLLETVRGAGYRLHAPG